MISCRTIITFRPMTRAGSFPAWISRRTVILETDSIRAAPSKVTSRESGAGSVLLYFMAQE